MGETVCTCMSPARAEVERLLGTRDLSLCMGREKHRKEGEETIPPNEGTVHGRRERRTSCTCVDAVVGKSEETASNKIVETGDIACSAVTRAGGICS